MEPSAPAVQGRLTYSVSSSSHTLALWRLALGIVGTATETTAAGVGNASAVHIIFNDSPGDKGDKREILQLGKRTTVPQKMGTSF